MPNKIADAVNAAVTPLFEQMKSLTEQLKQDKPKEKEVEVRRGLTSPQMVTANDPAQHTGERKAKLSSFSQAINKSVGLEAEYERPGALTK